MVTKFDLIESQLKEYKSEANAHYIKYLDDLERIINSSSDSNDDTSKSAEELLYLVKNDIYPYIITTKEFICNEFLERTEYYYKLKNDKDFDILLVQLYTDINNLYSFINMEVIEEKEKKEDHAFFSRYYTAIESLNVEYSSENIINHCKILIESLKNKDYFYTLNFSKGCEEYAMDKYEADGYEEKNLLNINKVIAQYEALIQPFDNTFINKYSLIKNAQEYSKIKLRYIDNLEKLKGKLIKDFDVKKLYSFHWFDHLPSCGYMGIYYPGCDDYPLRCLDCLASVGVVLDELIEYIQRPNGVDFTNREKEVLELIFKGYSTNQIANALTDEKSTKAISKSTVEKHINSILRKTQLNDTKDLLVKFS